MLECRASATMTRTSARTSNVQDGEDVDVLRMQDWGLNSMKKIKRIASRLFKTGLKVGSRLLRKRKLLRKFRGRKLLRRLGGRRRRPIRRKPVRRPTSRTRTYRRPARRPTYKRPTYRRPTYRRPTYRRPTSRRPTYRRPTYRRPTYRRPTYGGPVRRISFNSQGSDYTRGYQVGFGNGYTLGYQAGSRTRTG